MVLGIVLGAIATLLILHKVGIINLSISKKGK